VSAPTAMDDSFIGFLAAFAAENPDVRLTVDFSTRIVDLAREGYDVALRAVSGTLQPGLVARRIAQQEMIAVASPAYLSKHGTPRSLRDLRKHRCLTGFVGGELPRATWPARRGVVQVESVLSSNDARLMREAAVRGVGIAQVPRSYVEGLVDRGALVQVLRGQLEAELSIAVVFPDRELVPPHVRLFIERLVAWCSEAFGVRPTKRRR
jgi:DNA-binding transcriptional LysR family regulator